MPTITTRWEKRTYDVWGNADDGYTVNNSFNEGEFDLEIETQHLNPNSDRLSAFITADQLKDIFGINRETEIYIEGDDLHYDVSIADDGYPVGELTCVSHESLSPIKGIL